MPRKFAYLRVSTAEQGRSGVGLNAQEATCLRLGNSVQCPWHHERYPEACQRSGFIVDEISGYKNALGNRPGGRKLLNLLQPGDSIIMSNIDRGFRSLLDFCGFVAKCEKNKWNLVCASPPVDLSTPNGRAVANMFVLIAQWNSDIKSTRIKEGLAAKKAGEISGRKSSEHLPAAESAYRPQRRRIDVASDNIAPGRVVAYIRCSHRSSAESGLGLKYAMSECCQYGDDLIAEFPQLVWHPEIPVVTDTAVSARKCALKKRPCGGDMYRELRSGDHVIVLRPDRVFGSSSDMSETLIEWKKRGVTAHFTEMSLNLSTPWGEVILSILVAIAQFERDQAAERSRETRVVLESQGKFAGGRYPPFWRVLVVGGHSHKKRQLVIDGNQIATFRLIQRYRSSGMSVEKALVRLEELLARREGRLPIPQHGVHRIGKYSDLPENYLPDRNGTIYPMWTIGAYRTALKVWGETQRIWMEMRAEDRRMLCAIARQSDIRRPMSTARVKRLKRLDKRPMKRQPAIGVG